MIPTKYTLVWPELTWWLQKYYNHLADFQAHYDLGDDLYIKALPGADGSCVLVGFTTVDTKKIIREIMIPLAPSEWTELSRMFSPGPRDITYDDIDPAWQHGSRGYGDQNRYAWIDSGMSPKDFF